MKIVKTLALATCMVAATPSFAQDSAEEAVADQAVIKGMKIVTVPADTLSASDNSGRVVTSLNYHDIR